MEIENLVKLMSGMGVIITVVGLGITVVVVIGVFFLFWRIFGGMGRSNAERERLLRDGIQASARILNVEMGSMTVTVGVQRHLQLKLTVEVQPSGAPPYQTVLTTMISELQIPQVQPGVVATVRYDRNDPQKVVLEGVGMAASASPAGARSAVAIPMGGTPRLSTGAKIGIAIGALGALVGIGAAVVALVVTLGFGSIAGLTAAGSSARPSTTDPQRHMAPVASSGSDMCARAIHCCEVISGDAANCSSLGRAGMPTSACATAFTSYQRAAKAMGKKCS
jgi:hypothetical protein